MKTNWCSKSLLVGALSGVLSLLVGAGVAHAADREDIVRSEQAALVDVSEGTARGYDCETVRLEDGTFEAQCDEVAHRDESAACDAFVDATYDSTIDPEDRHFSYEACMVIALHTPGAVK